MVPDVTLALSWIVTCAIGAAMLVMLRSLSYGQALQGAYIGVSSAVPSIEELQRRLAVIGECSHSQADCYVHRLIQVAGRGP